MGAAVGMMPDGFCKSKTRAILLWSSLDEEEILFGSKKRILKKKLKLNIKN